MDPVSLTFGVAGIVGLSGLFSTCLDIIDRVQSYKDFRVESQSICAQFEADKLLLRRWARNVGIDDQASKPSLRSDLDDPETVLMIQKLLLTIRDIFSVTDSTLSSLAQPLSADSHSPHGTAAPPKAGSDSKRSKMVWALKGKAKFIAQVQQFGALVQRLENLVPSGGRKGVQPGAAHLDEELQRLKGEP